MQRAFAIVVLAVVALSFGCKNRSNRPGDTLTCTPGESLAIGCTGTVGSVCSGDPEMRACDGSVAPSACSGASVIAQNDDAEPGVTSCPLVETTCPASGRITVAIDGAMGADFACYWDIAHGNDTHADGGLGGD